MATRGKAAAKTAVRKSAAKRPAVKRSGAESPAGRKPPAGKPAAGKSDGFSANASRTVLASLERLYGAWADQKLRALWLGPAPIAVTRSTGGKSMRITWTAGGSNVDVNFLPAGDGRSRVQVEHGRLVDEDARRAQKSFWSDALDRLKAMLEKAA